MIPVYQTRFRGANAPAEEQGNCIAACLASIFELTLDQVPEFQGGRHWWDLLEAWCMQRNLLPLYISPLSSLLIPQTDYLLGVKSKTLADPNDGHMVVARGYHIIHDPNPNVQTLSWDDYDPEDATFFVKYF